MPEFYNTTIRHIGMSCTYDVKDVLTAQGYNPEREAKLASRCAIVIESWLKLHIQSLQIPTLPSSTPIIIRCHVDVRGKQHSVAAQISYGDSLLDTEGNPHLILHSTLYLMENREYDDLVFTKNRSAAGLDRSSNQRSHKKNLTCEGERIEDGAILVLQDGRTSHHQRVLCRGPPRNCVVK